MFLCLLYVLCTEQEFSFPFTSEICPQDTSLSSTDPQVHTRGKSANTSSSESNGNPPIHDDSISHSLPSRTRDFPVTTIKKGNEYVPLKILSFNARSLFSKYAHLSDLVYEENPDVLAITETFLDASILDSEFPDGYKTFRKDRDISWYKEGTYSETNRGGVLLLIKEELNPD